MRVIASTALVGVALLLAVFLRPATSEGQVQQPPASTDFEYDVLSGVQQASRLSDGWHPLGNVPSGYRVPWKRV